MRGCQNDHPPGSPRWPNRASWGPASGRFGRAEVGRKRRSRRGRRERMRKRTKRRRMGEDEKEEEEEEARG